MHRINLGKYKDNQDNTYLYKKKKRGCDRGRDRNNGD
jgi:hypothetical protein